MRFGLALLVEVSVRIFGDAIGDAVGQFERRLETFGETRRISSRTAMRSTTTSMSCFSFLSSGGASAIS